MDFTALIIQLIAGVVGGNAAGKVLKKYDLGVLGNSIAGLVGGGNGGQIRNMVLGGAGRPDAAMATGGGMDIGSIVGDVAGGGIGGAVLMIIVGLIRKAMAKA